MGIRKNIGVAVTTQNRPEVFKEALTNLLDNTNRGIVYIPYVYSPEHHLMYQFEHPNLLSIGETDMGVFNYVVREKFDNYEFGPQVNTTFKAYQDNGVAWWQHK